MPELAEVEVMRRNAVRWMAGRRIDDVTIVDAKLAPALVGFGGPQHADDRRFVDASRRGKLLLVELSGGVLALHFRMTGQIVPADEAARGVRLLLRLDDGTGVALVDPRRLGTAEWIPSDRVPRFLDALAIGPEPWPDRRDGAWWRDRLAGARGPIKSVLMDPARIGGIGNILASEVLFAAGIDPRRPADSLTPDELDALGPAAWTVIDAIVAAEDGGTIRFLHDGRDVATTSLAVYGRDGAPCVRCGTPIVRFRQAGRSTFACPSCQSPGPADPSGEGGREPPGVTSRRS